MVVALLVHHTVLAAHRKADAEVVHRIVAVEEADCSRPEEDILCLLSVAFLLQHCSRRITARRWLSIATIWLLICHCISWSDCNRSEFVARKQYAEKTLQKEMM
jgi:hypothetical protein